jgi:hypothetical protein
MAPLWRDQLGNSRAVPGFQLSTLKLCSKARHCRTGLTAIIFTLCHSFAQNLNLRLICKNAGNCLPTTVPNSASQISGSFKLCKSYFAQLASSMICKMQGTDCLCYGSELGVALCNSFVLCTTYIKRGL